MNPVQLFAIGVFRENVNKYIEERNSLDGVKEALYDILFKDDGCGVARIFRYFPSADDLTATQELGGLDGILDSIIATHKVKAYDALMEEKSRALQGNNGAQKVTMEELSLRDTEYTKGFDNWKNKKFGTASAPA